jgi:hypothetical protein
MVLKADKYYYIEEALKCKADPLYFISHYIKIELPGEEVPMPIYGKQKQLVRLLQDKHYVIVLKSRQIGISTISQAWCVYLVLFYSNITIGVISKDGSEATDFVRKARNMIELLPDFLKPKLVGDAKQSVETASGSRIVSAAVGSSNPGAVLRSKSLTFLVIDEAAHIPHIKEAYDAMAFSMGTVHKYAKEHNIPYGTIILSTPNGTTGKGKWFYDNWKLALEGVNLFTPLKIHYSDAPFADAEWLERQKRLVGYDPVIISQELELQFIMSKDSLFSDNESVSRKIQETQEPIEVIDRAYFDDETNADLDLTQVFKGQWRIFEEYDENKSYIIGVDVASSTGICNSAIVITDQDLNQVAEFTGKLRIVDFEEEIIFAATELYPNCLLIVEANYDHQLVERLAMNPDISYKMYFTDHYDDKGKITRRTPGFNTTAKTRTLLMRELYTVVNENPDRIKSSLLANEIISIRKDYRSNELSDLAISYGFICYVHRYEPHKLSLSLSDNERENMDRIFDLTSDYDEEYNEDYNDDNSEGGSALENELLDLLD